MIRIVHVFPETLGLFGDSGNVLALRKRAEWRGVGVEVVPVHRGDDIPANGDIYIIGSGSSSSVRQAAAESVRLASALASAMDNRDAQVVAIGGGLHVLTKRVDWNDGTSVRGAGLIDGVSVPRAQRLVGEFVGISEGLDVAGFINSGHDVVTNLEPHIREMHGLSISTDGVVFRGILGTHSHGAYLPMNPAIADRILGTALGSELPAGGERLARATVAANESRRAIRDRISTNG